MGLDARKVSDSSSRGKGDKLTTGRVTILSGNKGEDEIAAHRGDRISERFTADDDPSCYLIGHNGFL